MTKPGEQKRKRAVKVAAVVTVAGVFLLALAYNVVVTQRAQEVAICEAGEQAATRADHTTLSTLPTSPPAARH